MICLCVFLFFSNSSGVVSRSVVSDSASPQTVAHQAPLSMEFSRQEYWSRLPFPSPEDIPDAGIKPGSPILQADSLLSYIHPILSSTCNVFVEGISYVSYRISYSLDFADYLSVILAHISPCPLLLCKLVVGSIG